jgi:hypothetical protein
VFLDHASGYGLTRSLLYEINLIIPLVGYAENADTLTALHFSQASDKHESFEIFTAGYDAV